MQSHVLDTVSAGGACPGRLEHHLHQAFEAGNLGASEFDIASDLPTATSQCKANHGRGGRRSAQSRLTSFAASHPEFRAPFRGAITWPDGTSLAAPRRPCVEGYCMVGARRDLTPQSEVEEALTMARSDASATAAGSPCG